MPELRLLGPLEVHGPAGAIALGGAKQRLLLAVLVMHCDEFVSRERIVDALWPEEPPGGAGQTIESYVSRLRKALREAAPDLNAIVSGTSGYSFKTQGFVADRDEFERLIAAARVALNRGDAPAASRSASAALALWRGAALAGLDDQPALRAWTRSLEDRRLEAVQLRGEAQLACGRAAALVSELRAEAAGNPTREDLQRLLMLALYRAGRQSEALDVYADVRRHLSDELGLEPGPNLRELQERILRHDPELVPPATSANEPSPPQPRPRPRPAVPRARSSRQPAVAVGAFIALAAAIAILASAGGGGRSSDVAKTSRFPALGILSSAGRPLMAASLDEAPTRITSGLGAAWATAYDDGTLLRVDARRGVVTQTVHVGQGPTGVAVAGGDVWVADSLGGELVRVDGGAYRIVQRIAVGSDPTEVVAGAGALWVSDPRDGTVTRVDPETGAIRGVTHTGAGTGALAANSSAVWVAEARTNSVARLSPRTGKILLQIPVGSDPSALSISRDGLWVANHLDSTVSLIDAQSNATSATRAVTGTPDALAAAGSSVWVASDSSATITRLSASASARPIRLDSPVTALGTYDDRLIAGVRGLGADHRGGTLRVRFASAIDSGDPYDCCDLPWDIRDLAYDGLLGHSQAPGAEGTLVPDLALQVPRPELGGRLYVFRLRPALRFSNGRRLKASDVVRGIERAVAANPVWGEYLRSIRGATACGEPHHGCDLRHAIVADDRTGTIKLHLLQPDPEILDALGLSVFTPTPSRHGPPPAIGPYAITRFVADRRIEFSRNPYFTAPAPAAQPAGYPDHISVELTDTPSADVAAVMSGKADVTIDFPSARQVRQILVDAPGQLHSLPSPGYDFAEFNVHRPPFDDVRVRRALNLAFDRGEVARRFGGAIAAQPICQYIPKTIPGRAAYCPFTRSPGPSGRWSGPDLARARKLIAASGTAGSALGVWSQTGSQASVIVSRYLMELLRRLGYRPHLHRSSQFSPAVLAHRYQIAVTGLFADFPSPSFWLTDFLGCHDPTTVNQTGYCNPTVDALTRQATSLEISDPYESNRLWAKADRIVTDDAPWIPAVQELTTNLLARRVGNFRYISIANGPLFDQLWVK